ncbi:MAG: phenylalanine--tRNA ligase subunit beta, partial [Crocinitomicaceae bacterium]
MKISLNWLKEYIKTELEAEKIASILTDTGLEVDNLEKLEAVKGGLQSVVIGKVLSCEPHPDADRLKITTVDVGESEMLQIVCGAANVAKEQKVIVAKIGATLHPVSGESFKIKQSKIRGVESCGMLCAEDELGLGNSHEGIIVLNEDAVIGSNAADYFDLQDDYLIEIGLTPNRADAMGHIGVARDLKAYLNVHNNEKLTLNLPSVKDFKTDNEKLTVAIKVEDKELCPRYAGVTIFGVQVKASPEWMQKRLRTIGIAPINNIVDVTNYVLHELGTPLHAFDAAVVGNEINVRRAKEGEILVTLDNVERKLSSANLVIANRDKAMCLAGVFGGKESGVSDKTTAIFLEAAYFNPISIRKTAKEFGLNTDASFRFERGIDVELVDFALKRAAMLIKEVAGGEISMPVNDFYPEKIKPFSVNFSPEKCNVLIGITIPETIQETILAELDIKVESKSKEGWKLSVPSYRVDVKREIDVIEEILRIYGFNKVTLPEKLSASLSYRDKLDSEEIQNKIADQLVALGFSEMLNNSLTNSNYVEKLGGTVLLPEQNVGILNPLSNELNVMRQSLLFQTLEVVAFNQNRQQLDLKLFEFGKIYKKESGKLIENKRLIIALTGRKEEENWSNSPQQASFYTLKGIVNALYTKLGLKASTKEKSIESSILEDGIDLVTGKFKTATLGWISDKTKKELDIKQAVYIAEIDWDALLGSIIMNKVKFTEIPKTQIVRR